VLPGGPADELLAPLRAAMVPQPAATSRRSKK